MGMQEKDEPINVAVNSLCTVFFCFLVLYSSASYLDCILEQLYHLPSVERAKTHIIVNIPLRAIFVRALWSVSQFAIS